MNSIRILVVDDHAPFRRMLTDFLRSQGSVTVVGEAINGVNAVQMTDELKPDLVLMDLSMPGMSGFDAIKAIKEKYPKIKVVVLSSHSGEVYRNASINAHADGYIEKNSMKAALQAVLEHHSDSGIRLAV